MNRNNIFKIKIFANRNNFHEMKLWRIGIGIYLWPKYQGINLWRIYLQTICKLFANRELFTKHLTRALQSSPFQISGGRGSSEHDKVRRRTKDGNLCVQFRIVCADNIIMSEGNCIWIFKYSYWSLIEEILKRAQSC